MWVDSRGEPIQYFNPYWTLNRWDFATVFSRVLWWKKYNNNWVNYYSDHLNALRNAGFLTTTDHNLTEVRWYVMLMMYRAAKQIYASLENQIVTENSNGANSYSSTTNEALENEYAAIAARWNAAWASAGAIRAQQNEAYNRAVAWIDTNNCGSYDPHWWQSYGARLNKCQNWSSNSIITNSNNSYNEIYDALSNYIKTTNWIDTNEYKWFSSQKKTQDDYLSDLITAINANTNMYIPHINLWQNNNSNANRVINAINNLKWWYTPHTNFSISN